MDSSNTPLSLPSIGSTLAALRPGQRYAQPRPPGSGDALLLAALAREARHPLATFCADPLAARRLADEIALFDPDLRVRFLPDWETLPYDSFSPHQDLISERLRTLHALGQGAVDILVVPVTTALVRLAPPAFLAAYGGRNPATIPLMNNNNNSIKSNPFKYYTPMPNWRLTYNGLAKLPMFSDYVNTLTVNHSYTGNLSMNSFVSSFYYLDQLAVGFPSFIDSNSHNYVPFFQVPNITISESLGPLLGFDVAFKNGVSISIKFNKTRMLSLSLVDYQVSETKSTELVIGGGSRIKGLNLPFTIFGTRRLKNDINFRMDIGYRDDITSNSYLAQNTNIPTRGQKVITISPSIDYIINDNLQLRFFYDRRQSIPVMSTSFPITTTRAGMTLRFLFAPQ